MDERIKKYFEHPRKITKVEALEDCALLLTFDNGEQKIYNMKNKLQGVFEILKDPQKFNSVFIDEVGNIAWDIDDQIDSSIHWENRIDICKDALYLDSEPLASENSTWDPDYTKTTPSERKALQEAEHDFETGNTVDYNNIKWD